MTISAATRLSSWPVTTATNVGHSMAQPSTAATASTVAVRGVERSRPISPQAVARPEVVEHGAVDRDLEAPRADDHVLVAPLALGHHAGAGVVVDLVHPLREALQRGQRERPEQRDRAEHRGALAGHERRLVEAVGGGPRQDGRDRQDQARDDQRLLDPQRAR